MRQNLERKARINLYYIPFFPYLIYCNEVWGNASTVHASIDPIIKIQKKSIRTITFSSYLSPFNILNFRKLHGIIQKVSLLMFKISTCDVPKPLYMLYLELITYIITIRQGGVSLLMFQLVGRIRSAIYKTFSYFGAHIWNHISVNI